MTPGPARPPTRRALPPRQPLYSRRAMLVIAALVALAAGALALGAARSGPGGPGAVAPEIAAAPLEGFVLRPEPGSHNFLRAEVAIDLEPGWEGTLVLNGVEVPPDQLRIVAPENQAFFTPGPGRIVERHRPGQNCATAVFWQSQFGRGVDDARLNWCFYAG